MTPIYRFLILSSLITAAIAGSLLANASKNSKGGSDRMIPTVVKTIEILGVDAQAGNPEIRVMSTGALNLLFQVFPPSSAKTDAQAKRYETFDKQLEAFIGVPVSWEDRELFYVKNPRADTIEKIKTFVKSFPGPVAK